MEKKTFDTMKNGYNRFQVDDYVQNLQSQMRSLQKQVSLCESENVQLKEQVDQVNRAYQEVRDNLHMKEKAAMEMARMAMKEANRIIDTANDNADVIIREALMMARGILLDIAKIGNDANDMKDSMKEELVRLSQALEEFETPAIPDVDLLRKL